MDKTKTAGTLPPIEQLRGRTLGRVLIKMGILTREKVHECLRIQKQRHGGVQIGQIFFELGLVDENQLQTALAAQRGMEYIDVNGIDIYPGVIEKVPAQMARTYRIVPIEYNKEQNKLTVVLDNPSNFRATDDLGTLMGFRVTAKITDREALEKALTKYYETQPDENINELIGEIQGDHFLAEFEGRNESIDLDELKELSESNPIKKLLNLVLLQAIRDKASDIHFEPFENEYKMRYRIDGVLYEMIPPPKHIAAALSSRIKVMANLDIAERRLPQELNSFETKLITTEDPVEYDIDGIIQVQIKPDIGLTFARCLRHILRQDPDIILVGEIRDLETAEIAVQASLTGHLVFTTLHTNDAPSSIARLLDLGIEPFLVTATLEGIIAQRLIRKICENCKTPYEPTEVQLVELALTPEDIKGKKLYYGRGCDKCNNTGYRGRTAIFEIMTFNDEIRDLIMNQASTSVLRAAAQKAGMRLLRENGLAAIYDGITSIDEVVKETISEAQD